MDQLKLHKSIKNNTLLNILKVIVNEAPLILLALLTFSWMFVEVVFHHGHHMNVQCPLSSYTWKTVGSANIMPGFP